VSANATGKGKARQVTFYGDILPVLSADSRSRSYKCTTCHAHYREPEGLNSVPEIERIIESMKEGRMPRSTTKVTAAEIELFDVWRLQGFSVGRKPDLALSDDGEQDSEDCR
jgi:hypothetical protein